MKDRRLSRAGVLAVLVLACAAVLVPSGAMAKRAHSASAASEAQQNFNIRRATRATERQRNQIGKVTNSLSDAIEQLTGLDTTLKTLTPIVTKALTDLQSGLLALQGGLTFVGANLTALGSAYQAVEYG